MPAVILPPFVGCKGLVSACSTPYSVLALAWQQCILTTVVKFRWHSKKDQNAAVEMPSAIALDYLVLRKYYFSPDLLSANETGHLAKLITPLQIKFPDLATCSLSPMISRSGHSSYLPRAQLVAMLLERGKARRRILLETLPQRCSNTALPSGRRWDCPMSIC